MLEFYKFAHEKKASLIKGWEKENINDLINKCVASENDKKLYDAYISAIICRYWWKLNVFKSRSKNSVNDETIYYDWLVESVLKAIKNRKWVDKDNKLYTDKDGPDKVVNTCLKCARLGWYQQENRPGKKANHVATSIEEIIDDFGDSIFENDSYLFSSGFIEIKDLVNRYMRRGEYVSAFAISGIVLKDVFDRQRINGKRYVTFSKKKLVKYLYNLTNGDCERFSYFFGVPLSEALEAKNECSKLSRGRMHTAIKHSLNNIKRDYIED